MVSMEVIGTVASVGTIASGVFKALVILNAIKQGGKQRLRLLTAVSALWTALQSVESNLYPEDGETSQHIPDFFERLRENKVFTDIEAIVNDLNTTLEPSKGASGFFKDLKWPLKKVEVESSIKELEQLTNAVNLALASSTLRTLGEVRSRIMDAEFKAMLEWITPYDFVKQQHKLKDQIHEGTGRWFLEKPEFQSWVLNHTTTLWCPGIPGAGKTHLATIVCDHLRATSDNLTLIVYCGYIDPSDQTPGNFFRILIRQIVQLRPEHGEKLRNTYRTYSNEGKQLSIAQLSAIFDKLILELKDCFIIVDALDDVQEESKRYELLTTVTQKKTNVMVTSRPLENIRNFFRFESLCEECENYSLYFLRTGASEEDSAYVCEACFSQNHVVPPTGRQSILKVFNARRLDIEASQADLRNYVSWRIDDSGPLSKCVKRHDMLREEIMNEVVQRAKGMFLLAKLHMDAVVSKRTPNAVRKALQELPSGVNDTYDRALLRIKPPRKENNEEDSKYAMNLLMWMTFARRPLTIAEMEHAVTISFEMFGLPPDEDCLMKVKDIDPDEVLSASELTSLCAGLVIIDASDKVLFVHFTTQDYFLANSSELFPEAHLALARSCLTYLSLEPFRKGPCPEPYRIELQKRALEYPLMIYCSNNLGWHGQRTKSQILTLSILNFLRDRALLKSTSQALERRDFDFLSSNSYGNSGVPPLHIAAHWGFNDVVQVLLMDESVDSTCPQNETPLIFAVRTGQAAVVETLLQAGANPNALFEWGVSALYYATLLQNLPIIKLLLTQEDIKVEPQPLPHFDTLWMLTQLLRNSETAEILLSRADFDINFQDQFKETLLHDAVRRQDHDLMRFLIRHGARSDTPDKSGRSAQMIAENLGDRKALSIIMNTRDKPADRE